MWKLCTCVLLISIQLVHVQSNGFGWGSGDNNGGNQGAQQPHNSVPDTSISSSPPQYEQSAGKATNENYWWLSSNPFQKPPNHPGVERGVDQNPSHSSPGPSSNYGNQVKPAQNQNTGAYGSNQPSYIQSNPAYGSSNKPQVQPIPQNPNPGSYNTVKQPQPSNSGSYGNVPSSAGSGWGSPSSPSQSSGIPSSGGFPAQPNPSKPSQNYQLPTITFEECQLKNKADCHAGSAPIINPGYNQVDSPSYNNQQVGPQPSAYPEISSSSYAQPKPQVPVQQNQAPFGGNSYGSIPQKTPQIQPVPQNTQYQPINQNPSIPQPVKTPAIEPAYQPSPNQGSYASSGSNSNPSPAPKPSQPYQPEKPYNSAPNNQYQSAPIPSAQSSPLPVQNTNNYGPSNPQKPTYGAQSENPVVDSYNPNKVQPQTSVNNNAVYQPNPASTYNPSNSPPKTNNYNNVGNSNPVKGTPQSPQYTGQNYQPQQPAFTGNTNNNNYEVQPPYPGCPAALLCVQDNLCNSEGVIADKPQVLSAAEQVYRVALMACSAPGTGAVGVCCRDPNYKDPWPDMNGNGNGGGKEHHHHPDGNKGNHNGQSGFYQPNGQQTHQPQASQQPQGASSFPPQQQQPSNNFNSYSAVPKVRIEILGNTSDSIAKNCRSNEECVESYLCHNGFIIPSETEQEALAMGIDIRLNTKSKKCYEDYDGIAFVCCERKPTEKIIIDYFEEHSPAPVTIPIVTEEEDLETNTPILVQSSSNLNNQNGTQLIETDQKSISVQNSDMNSTYNRGLVQSLTQLNYVTLESSQGQNVFSETADTELPTTPTTTTAPLPVMPRKVEKIRIQLTSNIGGGPPSNFMIPKPFSTSLITGTEGNVVSGFKVSAPQNVKITDVTDEVIYKQLKQAPLITRSSSNENQGGLLNNREQSSRGRMLRQPEIPENTTETPSEITTKKQYENYKDPVLVVPPPQKQPHLENSSESDESDELNNYKTIHTIQKSEVENQYDSMESSEETSMESNSQIHREQQFDLNNVTVVQTSTERNEFTATSPKIEASTRTVVDILFFGPLPSATIKSNEDEQSGLTVPTTPKIEKKQNSDMTTTEKITTSTDRSKTHLYPFYNGEHRESTFITSETGEKIKVPSQYYDPPSLTPVDLLKLILPPTTAETDLINDASPSERREIHFLSPISAQKQTVVDVCPENMKCLSEAYCSIANANEGDTDSFDIRLQVRKRSTRQKCRQPNLPVDGYCCFLREDFAALNRTLKPGKERDAIIIKKKNNDSCGIRRPQDADHSPNDGSTAFGEFPWQALIFAKGQPHCSGVILNQRIVVTTATCLNSSRLDEVLVRVGEWDIANEEETKPHQDLLPKAFVIHPGFKSLGANIINDIALIVTSENIKFDYHVSRICLPQPFDRFDEKRCLATGWSTERPGIELKLKQSSIPVISNLMCDLKLRTSLGEDFRVHRTSVCAGGEATNDSCVVNPGGPLVCEDAATGSYTLAGLSSWGNPCQRRGEPGVYTYIPAQIDWIYTVLRKDANDIK